MKFTVTVDSFRRLVESANRAVASRSTLPVLGNLLVQASEDNTIRVVGTNLEIALAATAEAQVKKAGATTIPAKPLSDLLKLISADTVSVSFDANKATVTLTTKAPASKTNLKTISAEEFPNVPSPSSDGAIEVDPGLFRSAIDRVALVASEEETRPILTGVRVVASGTSIQFEAADGFQLARQVIAAAVPGNINMVIPARGLLEFRRQTANAEDTVRIFSHNGNQAVLQCGNVTLVSQLIEGNYPDLNAVIPKNHNTKVTVSTESLARAVRSADIMAREAAHTIRMRFDLPTKDAPGTIRVSAISAETGDQETYLDATVEGKAMEIALNAKYLADTLRALNGSGNVVITTTDDTKPLVLRLPEDDDYVYVVMPMYLYRSTTTR